MNECPSEDDAGFTVLELIVALTVATLVFGACLAGLYGGRRALAKVTAEMQSERTASAILHLNALLGEAGPYSSIFSGEGRVSRFIGTEQQITFVSPYTAVSQRAGLYWYRLAYSTPDRSLVLYQNALQPRRSSNIATFNLLSNLREIHFRYFGAPGMTQAPYWAEIWNGTLGGPDRVEISIVHLDGSSQTFQIPIVQAHR